ncbi:hypothetical protein JB92DRAFT_2938541 [Gautieria morchelliformis]|nr:hypothetical protein JB92DRAFT_2938541 [Gautieria morchelliformis]
MFVENDVVVQGGSSITPFGGVGPSGCMSRVYTHVVVVVFFVFWLSATACFCTILDGSHKGKYSFETFVHHRSSFNSPKWIDSVEATRFPPYTVSPRPVRGTTPVVWHKKHVIKSYTISVSVSWLI